MFLRFKTNIDGIALPERFTFPFYYVPHPLAGIAAKELQHHLQTQTDFEHNFGLEEGKEGPVLGKMFGVLVVRNADGELGYLSAFSGKIAEALTYPGFVPPVFDIHLEDSIFSRGIVPINEINARIKEMESHPIIRLLRENLSELKQEAEQNIKEQKALVKQKKKERDQKRKETLDTLTKEEYELLHTELNEESRLIAIRLKRLKKEWSQKIEACQKSLDNIQSEIDVLKIERKEKSSALQAEIFKAYTFLNQAGKSKSLLDIFGDEVPKAGAGECAAPKLLQYAFLNGMDPICMAEFWWGASPKSEIRRHGDFYPACRGKCYPILGHMLEGIETDENPMLQNMAFGKKIPILYEDEAIVIINKPHEFLSVPGKHVQDSVQFRFQVRYPEATGPMVVHRLDMSTSGLMIITKTKEHYQFIQAQFINRKVKKRYRARLDGIIKENEGTIDLPLRVDLEDRPRQLVCYEHGKRAVTRYQVLERKENQTLVHFFPETGRTHQLRVHSAHHLGLNCPIIGDDIYGRIGERLHLHSEYIGFIHPISKEWVEFEVEAGF